MRKLLPDSPLTALGEPLQLVLPILQERTEIAEDGRINTPADPVLTEAVCPGSGTVPAWVRLLREKPVLPVGILLAAYLLCRYFIGWKGVHKPAFQSFEAGFLASGGVSGVSLAGMYFGAAAPVLDILTALSAMLVLRAVFAPRRSMMSRLMSAVVWCAVFWLYPCARFAVPLILAGLMMVAHLLLGRRGMEKLSGRESMLVADSGIAGLAAGLLYTAVFFDLHLSCAVPAAVPFALLAVLAFCGPLKKEGSGLY